MNEMLLVHHFFRFVNGVDMWGFIFFGLPILGMMICSEKYNRNKTIIDDNYENEYTEDEILKMCNIQLKLSNKDIFEIEQVIKRSDRYNSIEDIIEDYLANNVK